MYILAIATGCFYGVWYIMVLSCNTCVTKRRVTLRCISTEQEALQCLFLNDRHLQRLKLQKNFVRLCFSFITKPILLKTSMKIIFKMRLLSSFITKVLWNKVIIWHICCVTHRFVKELFFIKLFSTPLWNTSVIAEQKMEHSTTMFSHLIPG